MPMPMSMSMSMPGFSQGNVFDYIRLNIGQIPDVRGKPMHVGLPLPDEELDSLLQMVRNFS